MPVYRTMSPYERDELIKAHLKGVSDALGQLVQRVEAMELKLDDLHRRTTIIRQEQVNLETRLRLYEVFRDRAE